MLGSEASYDIAELFTKKVFPSGNSQMDPFLLPLTLPLLSFLLLEHRHVLMQIDISLARVFFLPTNSSERRREHKHIYGFSDSSRNEMPLGIIFAKSNSIWSEAKIGIDSVAFPSLSLLASACSSSFQ
jgi:hypothetical protein